MSLLDELRTLGVNVEEGLDRFMGNAALYERMLKKFPDMIEKTVINSEFGAEDVGELIEKTHTIKGVTGNLSLTPLYEAYTRVVDLLRGGEVSQAESIYRDVLATEAKIVACIRAHQ